MNKEIRLCKVCSVVVIYPNIYCSRDCSAIARRGFRHSVETKRKIGVKSAGHIVTNEIKAKISKAKRGIARKPEVRAKLSQIKTGSIRIPREKRECLFCKKEFEVRNTATQKYCSRYCIAHNRVITEETRNKMKISHKHESLSEQHRKKISLGLLKHYKENPQSCQKIKDRWNNQLYREKVISKALSNCGKHPNKTEIKFHTLLQRVFPNFWEYVGNGIFLLGTKNPDFINRENKLIIELFGEYWHTKIHTETPEERMDYFAQYGYKTLIVWDYELKNEHNVVLKLLSFCGASEYSPTGGL